MTHQTQILFQEISRDYRTEIPNIVFELLESGEISSNDMMLYLTYRRVAGEHGACWIGTRGLTKKTRLSDKTITKSKINLSRPFAALGGKSLITITPCNRKNEEADTVMIIDIWKENFEHFIKKKREAEKLKKRLTCSKIDDTGVVKETTRVWENRRHKKEPYKKEPYEESSSTPEVLKKPSVPTSKNDDDDKKEMIADDKKEKEHSSDIVVTKTNGQTLRMSQSDVYRYFLSKPQIPTEVLREAIERIREVVGPINNILKYLETTCLGIIQNQKNNTKSLTETKKSSRNYSNFGPIEHRPTITMGELIRRKQEEEKKNDISR